MNQPTSVSLDVSVAMDTDIGRRRKQNQDAIGHMVPSDPEVLARLGQIFVLADGVGGLAGGDLASQYAVSTIISSYYEQEQGDPPERLARAIAEANSVIYAEGQGQETPSLMATTVVAAVVRGRELIIGSVGDSPAYLMRDASVRKLTRDHTVEGLADRSVPPLVADPQARKLVRALGSEPTVKVDIISGQVRDGDHVVLCSDGLTRYIAPAEIEQIVATRTPPRAVKALIELANERGGGDNISVIVLRLKDLDEALQPVIPATVAPPASPPRASSAPLDDGYTRLHQPPAPVVPPDEAPVVAMRRRARRDNPLLEFWHLLRVNPIVTAIGLLGLLALFVVIMMVVVDFGGSDNITEPSQMVTAPAAGDRTATAVLYSAATAQMAAMQTNDAVQAAEVSQAATAAVLTQTPPAPAGPIMEKDDWFRVLPGSPIPAFESADVNAKPGTELVAGSNYLIEDVNTEAWNGPWYQVVDNQGSDLRWVNGPSLHQRVLRVSPSGDALPPDEQPTDVPPSVRTPTRVPTQAGPTPGSGTPGTPGTPGPAQVTIPYGVESWDAGQQVALKTDLDLCRIPDIHSCDMGRVSSGEVGSITDGPTASGEHWWWRVQFPDGRAGWIAQVLLGPA